MYWCHLTQISPMDIPSCPAWISQRHRNSFTAELHHQWCLLQSWLEAPWLHRVEVPPALLEQGYGIPTMQLSFHFMFQRGGQETSSWAGGYEQQPLTSLDSLESWITGLHSSFLLPCSTAPFLSLLANIPVVKLHFFMVPQTYLMLLMHMGFHTIYLGSRRNKGIALFTATQMLYISNGIFMYSYSHHLTTDRQFLYALELGYIL